MVQTLKLGSLYLDDKPVTPEAKYQSGKRISFGDAVPDKAIKWVPVNGLLIADRCLLTDIRWDDLDAQGLVFGKEIKVQGFRFMARLFKVGDNKDVPNEWDAALDAVGEDNALWHWDRIFFWGQESVSGLASYRAIRGYNSARYWNWYISSFRTASLGFRPALAPMPTAPSVLRLGQSVIAVGRDGGVVGELVDETQYDFIIRPKTDVVTGTALFTTEMGNNLVAVDRSRVLSVTSCR